MANRHFVRVAKRREGGRKEAGAFFHVLKVVSSQLEGFGWSG